MPIIDPELKRPQIEKLVKYAFMLAGGAVAFAASVPLAALALEGILLWIAVGLIALLFVNFAPAVATYAANKKIAALKAVIERNPIETMQNLYADKHAELDRAENNITDFETELGSFRDKVEVFKVKYAAKAPAYLMIQTRMEECLAGMRLEQASATRELAAFQDKIDEAEAIFDMAKAANKMLEKSQTAQQAVYAQIKESVALDKVRNDLNRAFANLNTAMERRKNAAFVASPPQPVAALPPMDEATIIDAQVTRVETGERMRVRR